MKYLIAIVITMFAGSAMADCCCAKPKPKKPACAAKVVTKTVVVEKEILREVPVYREVVRNHVKLTPFQRKNRINLLAGMGPNRLEMEPNEAIIRRGLVGGVQYQRLLSERWNVGIQVQTNSTTLGSIGYDF